jgi:hypothetical protein
MSLTAFKSLNLSRRVHLVELSVTGCIILKFSSGNRSVNMWIGFSSLKVGFVGEFL